METKMVPTYATLTLAYLEENIYEIIGKKIQQHKRRIYEVMEKIFLMIVSYSGNAHGETLMNYTTYSKTYTPKIKFSMEHSSKELPFLDILIKSVNGQIITDIYYKSTDTQQYFHFNSHHLKNCIKSIPYTQAHRICTIISDKTLNL